jgi:NAD(P) transhydrogenase subunit beta
MLIAIVVTFLQDSVVSYWEIGVGMAVGGLFGAVAARKVRMTAMPQMVALFNGVGGGAAALISLAEFHNLAPDPGTLQTTSACRSCCRRSSAASPSRAR